jgi:hypothetical protein
MEPMPPALVAITDQWNASLRDMSETERLQFASGLLGSALRHILDGKGQSLPMVMGHLALASDAVAGSVKSLPAPSHEQIDKFRSTAELIPKAIQAMAHQGRGV